MAWEARVIDIAKRANGEGQQVVTLLFTDGDRKLQRDYSFASLNLASLQAFARQQVARLEADPPVIDLGGIEVGMVLDLSVPEAKPAPEPSKDEADRETFTVLATRMRQLDRAVSLGLLASDHADVTAARGALKAAFTPDFVELV